MPQKFVNNLFANKKYDANIWNITNKKEKYDAENCTGCIVGLAIGGM